MTPVFELDWSLATDLPNKERLFILLALLAVLCPAAAFARGDRHFDAAYAAKKRGDLDAAIAEYTLALNAGDLSRENRAPAFNNRGNAYEDKRQYDRARRGL